MSFNIAQLKEDVEFINNHVGNDVPADFWADEFRRLAIQILEFYGHKVSHETSEVTTNKAIAKMAGTRL